MQTASQQSNTKEICMICGGKGRVKKQTRSGGRKRTQLCVQCRGSGYASGYRTK